MGLLLRDVAYLSRYESNGRSRLSGPSPVSTQYYRQIRDADADAVTVNFDFTGIFLD